MTKYAIKDEGFNSYTICTRRDVLWHMIIWKSISVFFMVVSITIVIGFVIEPPYKVVYIIIATFFLTLIGFMSFYSWKRSNEWRKL